jgi:hypothetical protein
MDSMITIFDDQEACVKINESLMDQKEFIISKLKERLDFYKKIFNQEQLDKLTYIMFDDLDTYRNTMLSKYNYQCPEYSRGMFNMNAKASFVCITPEIKSDKYRFYKMLLSNAHEAFHYYYRKYIYIQMENRVLWFDEGIAQYFSGEYSFLVDDNFKQFFYKWKNEYKPINNLNDRVQGRKDVPDELIFKREGVFNGYNTCYLIIRYLVETQGEQYIIDLMKDRDRILELGNSNIIDDMKNYYINKFESKVL